MTVTETPPREDPGRRGPGRNHRVSTRVALVLVGVLAVVLALAAFLTSAPTTPAAVAHGPASGAPAASVPAPAPLARAVPLRVSVPSIAASSSLVALGVNPDHSLAVPPLNRPMQASWFDGSPTPGQVGPSVVLGHVNGNGKRGIFADLDKVRPGQQVMIDRADGQTAVFTVARVELVPKDAFPTARVYGDTAGPQLRLITCGGDLDRKHHNYLSNVVVYATLTAVRPT